MIFFIGAGCWHPDMITVGAVRILKEADCILYDHLLNPELLQYAKSECECICVGKSGHHPSFPQEQILTLLKEKDAQYPLTVRLKGGDPYLYGRGSEEMLFCLENGISCQYVPGISSAIGALGFAGIPVTERGTAAGFHVHTLHSRDGQDHLDYRSIAASHETEIFFMGSTRILSLAQHCLENGMPEDTPITLASHLTMPDQKVAIATLKTVSDLDLSAFSSPMLIVLGKCALHQKLLDNTARLSCYGKRVLLCSLDDTPWPMEDITLKKGIFPSVRQVAEIRFADADLPDLSRYNACLFVSRHSVEAFLHLLIQNGRDLRALASTSIFCIGRTTADTLRQKGILPDAVFASRDDFSSHHPENLQLLWIGPEGTEPAEGAAGFLGCYTVSRKPFAMNGPYDAAGATCPAAVEALQEQHLALDTPLFCFAKRTYEKAKEAGFTDITVCESSREAILTAMIRRFEKENAA